MSLVFFVTPTYNPVFFPPVAHPPMIFFPSQVTTYTFPIPMLYSTPPPAVL